MLVCGGRHVGAMLSRRTSTCDVDFEFLLTKNRAVHASIALVDEYNVPRVRHFPRLERPVGYPGKTAELSFTEINMSDTILIW